MPWIRRQIQKLQNRPYEARVKLLWTAVGCAGIVLLIVWLATLRYRSSAADSSPSKFGEIWENLKRIKDIRPSALP